MNATNFNQTDVSELSAVKNIEGTTVFDKGRMSQSLTLSNGSDQVSSNCHFTQYETVSLQLFSSWTGLHDNITWF